MKGVWYRILNVGGLGTSTAFTSCPPGSVSLASHSTTTQRARRSTGARGPLLRRAMGKPTGSLLLLLLLLLLTPADASNRNLKVW